MLTTRAPNYGADASGRLHPMPVVSTPAIVLVVILDRRLHVPLVRGVEPVIQFD